MGYGVLELTIGKEKEFAKSNAKINGVLGAWQICKVVYRRRTQIMYAFIKSIVIACVGQVVSHDNLEHSASAIIHFRAKGDTLS